ncbi:MAG: hypothetical protein GWO16_01715 [Gammaproteobacteria bacterium]|nr:hypothetical protein [Gammaproteobacteria bacterium]NIR96851.1 hypothetical protein [Gammaproteobacteria bacterium]NIT62562.1 hypothetical protein [Gammaproteobacteria bacterium]NIV19506.1 hypothetical protein [Gammaproteobacteria bacterium]NIY31142.1 hypothetical protein [Gammaproteobacteria bacterium]
MHPEARNEARRWNGGGYAEHRALGQMLVVIDELELIGPSGRPPMERRPCWRHREVPVHRMRAETYEMLYAVFEASRLIAILSFGRVESQQDRIDADRLGRRRLDYWL